MHDEVKDKMFELELSWVGEFTDGVHKRVPEDVSFRNLLTDCISIKLLVVLRVGNFSSLNECLKLKELI